MIKDQLYGAPHVLFGIFEKEFSKITENCRFERYDWKRLTVLPEKPRYSKLSQAVNDYQSILKLWSFKKQRYLSVDWLFLEPHDS